MNGFSWYWLVWFLTSVVTFLIPEVYALVADPANTLSENVWRLLDVLPGQSIMNWDAIHLLLGGALALLLAWLLGHLVFGLWA